MSGCCTWCRGKGAGGQRHASKPDSGRGHKRPCPATDPVHWTAAVQRWAASPVPRHLFIRYAAAHPGAVARESRGCHVAKGIKSGHHEDNVEAKADLLLVCVKPALTRCRSRALRRRYVGHHLVITLLLQPPAQGVKVGLELWRLAPASRRRCMHEAAVPAQRSKRRGSCGMPRSRQSSVGLLEQGPVCRSGGGCLLGAATQVLQSWAVQE